jgi:hypothetical protein
MITPALADKTASRISKNPRQFNVDFCHGPLGAVEGPSLVSFTTVEIKVVRLVFQLRDSCSFWIGYFVCRMCNNVHRNVCAVDIHVVLLN